jgi:hypothetical protein
MSGYDKHPDYGGPPVTKWTYIWAAVIAIVVVAVTIHLA